MVINARDSKPLALHERHKEPNPLKGDAPIKLVFGRTNRHFICDTSSPQKGSSNGFSLVIKS